jgi:hypothetical protein
MSDDLRRLVIPESIAGDPRAYELLAAWVTGTGKVSVMTRSGTRLDQNPAIWGEILAAIAGNVALSVKAAPSADASATMAAIKDSLDRAWLVGPGRHYRNADAIGDAGGVGRA